MSSGWNLVSISAPQDLKVHLALSFLSVRPSQHAPQPLHMKIFFRKDNYSVRAFPDWEYSEANQLGKMLIHQK